MKDLDYYYKLIMPVLPSADKDRKPHKALILLSVLFGIADGKIRENKIYFDECLKELFSSFFRNYGRPQDSNRPHTPFFHLRSSGFWHLVAKEGRDEELNAASTIGSEKDLNYLVEYAYLDDDLYRIVLNEQSGKKLIKAIMDSLILRGSNSDHPPKELTGSEADVAGIHDVPSIFDHEQQAIREIMAALGNHIQFIPNYHLHDPATNRYHECDLIAICQDRLAVIELKHWTGMIEVFPQSWVINRQSHRPDPHIVNNYRCKLLKSFYQRSFPTLPGLYVESMVVLTNTDAKVHNADTYKTDQHNPTFAGLEEVIRHFTYRFGAIPQIPGARKLTPAQVKMVADKLRSQAALHPQQRLNLPGYEIVENLTRTKKKLEFLIRPTEKRFQTIKRARIFCVDLTVPPDARRIERERALNGLGALEKVGDHPNILRVWRITNDDGLIIEGSDWSQEGTLADAIRRKGVFSLEETLPILQGILEGLSAIHNECVIHRDLRPQNVLLSRGIPKLMNFDLSYYPEEERVTVIPDTAALEWSAYMAPEIFRGGSLTEGADLFSLGVILFEMLCGEKPFKYSVDLDGSGGKLAEGAVDKLRAREVPREIEAILVELLQSDPAERPKNARAVLNAIEGFSSTAVEVNEGVPAEANRKLEPGERYDVYEIESFIAEGREAQVYRAKQTSERRVALKLFNKEVERERIYAEQWAMERVKSPYVVRCKTPGCWEKDRFFLALDLIEGVPFRKIIEEGARPDVTTFRHVAACLLDALDRMHNDPGFEEPLLHNDIKPENILLNKNGDPVFIDFGTACRPQVAAFMGTPGYVAPDLVQGADLDYRPSGDLFALGVTLFEWLCGVSPYEEIPGRNSIPKLAIQLRPELPVELDHWLNQSIQPLEANRFADIQTMRAAFEQIFAVPEPQESLAQTLRLIPSISTTGDSLGNAFVEYLNTLHNVTAENENALAEAQALSRFFGSIHVPLEVTRLIAEHLKNPSGRVVLTGHAGDGKSTIGLEIYKQFKGLPMDEPLSKPLKSWEQIPLKDGGQVHMLKDMSELSEAERVERLQQICRNDTPGDRWLIISNTGTFLATLKAYAEVKGLNPSDLEDEVLGLLEVSDPGFLHGAGLPILVVNLARIDNLGTARQLLAKMLAGENWNPCLACNIKEMCPVLTNISALRERETSTAERVGWIYRRLYEYGSRLTMRQIAGHLAYSITSGLDCRTIRNYAAKPIPPDMTDFLFFNRFFGFAGTHPDPGAQRLAAVRFLFPLEFGTKPYPSLDRRLWTHEEDAKPAVAPSFEFVFGQLGKMIHAGTAEADPPLGRLRQEMRRFLFLFSEMPKGLGGFYANFLESQMLIKLESWKKEGKIPNALEKDRLLKRVLHVLQEQFTGMPISEQDNQKDLYVTLKRSDEELRQTVQILLAKIPLTCFALSMEKVSSSFNSGRCVLTLVDKISNECLPLDLPFLDFVLMRGMGEVGHSLDPGYADRLERFKAGLLRFKNYCVSDGLELLEFTSKGAFKVHKLIIGEKLQVISCQ